MFNVRRSAFRSEKKKALPKERLAVSEERLD